MRALAKSSYAHFSSFQDNLVEGRPNEWRCRAGGRYLYICEDGLVHYCSQQRGYPAVPLEKYTMADLRREFFTEKSCAPHCTISCVHQVAYLDAWRAPQHSPASAPAPQPGLVPDQRVRFKKPQASSPKRHPPSNFARMSGCVCLLLVAGRSSERSAYREAERLTRFAQQVGRGKGGNRLLERIVACGSRAGTSFD